MGGGRRKGRVNFFVITLPHLLCEVTNTLLSVHYMDGREGRWERGKPRVNSFVIRGISYPVIGLHTPLGWGGLLHSPRMGGRDPPHCACLQICALRMFTPSNIFLYLPNGPQFQFPRNNPDPTSSSCLLGHQ